MRRTDPGHRQETGASSELAIRVFNQDQSTDTQKPSPSGHPAIRVTVSRNWEDIDTFIARRNRLRFASRAVFNATCESCETAMFEDTALCNTCERGAYR